MQFETFTALTAIRSRWPIEYGKIIQLLLGISFDIQRGGYSVENRSTEGVDLELTRGAAKFAVEVKTTDGATVTLLEKDILGLKKKSRVDGYVPAVAALQLQRSSEWVIANATRLRAGNYTPSRLLLDSIADLQLMANDHFEVTVVELRSCIMSPPGRSPLDYLASVLLKESK